MIRDWLREQAKEDERAAVVAYLRERADAPHPIERGAPALSPAGRGLLLLMADRIERGEHRTKNNGVTMIDGTLPAIATSPYRVGDVVFVRTVTYHYTGRISAIYAGEIVLEDAAWIADSGRFGAALATGELSEVEPYPGSVIVSRGAIVDVSAWAHPLPRVAQ